jgi:hypothetical protein
MDSLQLITREGDGHASVCTGHRGFSDHQPAPNHGGADVDPYTQQLSRPYYSSFPNYGAINDGGHELAARVLR